MEHIKKKIKLSMPIVTLYHDYSYIINEISTIDKSTSGAIDSLIKTIPHLIDELKKQDVRSVDNTFRLAQLSSQYDHILSHIYDAFNNDINVPINAQITSNTLNKSDDFIKQMGTMFREILAMYNKYIEHIQSLNIQIMDELVNEIKHLSIDEVCALYANNRGSALLYGHYIQHKLNQYDVSYSDKLILQCKVSELKNDVFKDTPQQQPSKHNPPLQNMGCVAIIRRLTIADIIQICLKKNVAKDADEKVLNIIASESDMGVLMITNRMPGDHIYDIGKLLGRSNTKAYRDTDSSCLTERTLDRYNNIIKVENDKYQINVTTMCNKGCKKWIVVANVADKLYDLMHHRGTYTIHRSIIRKLLRGPSVRIQAVNKKYCDAIRKLTRVTDDDVEPDVERIDTNFFANKLYNAVVQKFIQLMNKHKPTSCASLKPLITHVEMEPIIHRVLVENIEELKNADNDDYLAELYISASADMTNIVDNFRLSAENEFTSLNISHMIFKEKNGDVLYSTLISRIVPIYLKVFNEILLGKTDIFTNIRDKNNKLNTTRVTQYM